MSLKYRQIFTADSRFAVVPQNDGKPAILTGYALVWNVLSADRGGYKVRLLPNSATFATPTLALYHHDFRDVIGNSENGTLRYKSDAYGVKVEIDLPDTQCGRDTLFLVEKKYVRGMSFSMVSSPRGHITRENGQDILEAEAYAVDEVSVTPIPAFIETFIGMKGPDDEFAVRRNHALQLQRLKINSLRIPGAIPRAAV